MTNYQVTFVYSQCSVSVGVQALDEDKAADIAENWILHELGLTVPKNVSLEIEEIN